MPDRPEPEPQPSGGRLPRLGSLTVLAVAVVVGGILIFGWATGEAADPAETESGSGLSLPPMPATEALETATDFSVELFDGTRFILGEHLREDGRPVILNLWASWCYPCRAEMPDLEAAARAHPEVLILGVAVDDDPDAAEEFAEEIGISYPIGADRGDRVHRRYPAPGLPATFVISPEGTVLTNAFGQLTAGQIDDLIALATAG